MDRRIDSNHPGQSSDADTKIEKVEQLLNELLNIDISLVFRKPDFASSIISLLEVYEWELIALREGLNKDEYFRAGEISKLSVNMQNAKSVGDIIIKKYLIGPQGITEDMNQAYLYRKLPI